MSNRRLDALIAEHVYAIVPRELINPDGKLVALIDSAYTDRCVSIPSSYSSDVALAIGVLEKLASKGKLWSVANTGIDIQVQIGVLARNGKAYVGLSLPEAICRHVVSVLGLDSGEKGEK